MTPFFVQVFEGLQNGTMLGVLSRVERTPEMFRRALYSPLLSPFGTRECRKIQTCIVGSLPLTEGMAAMSYSTASQSLFDGEPLVVTHLWVVGRLQAF